MSIKKLSSRFITAAFAAGLLAVGGCQDYGEKHKPAKDTGRGMNEPGEVQGQGQGQGQEEIGREVEPTAGRDVQQEIGELQKRAKAAETFVTSKMASAEGAAGQQLHQIQGELKQVDQKISGLSQQTGQALEGAVKDTQKRLDEIENRLEDNFQYKAP